MKKVEKKPTHVDSTPHDDTDLFYNSLKNDRGTPLLLRKLVKIMTLFLAGLFVWAIFVKVDERTSAEGSIVPSASVQQIQHLEGGIIKEILVEEGQLVAKDQVLIQLQPELVESQYEQLTVRKIGLQLQENRLRAYLDNIEFTFSNIEQIELYQHLVDDQQNTLISQQAQDNAEKSVLVEQLEQYYIEEKTLLNNITSMENRVALASEEVNMHQDLHNSGHSSRLQLVRAKGNLESLQSELERLHGDYDTTQSRVTEYQARLDELDFRQKEQAYVELGQITTELNEVTQALIGYSDRVQRLDIIAPMDGLIHSLAIRTDGGVIEPGMIIAELVPYDSELIAEVNVLPKDIGFIEQGQPASVKILSYDFTRFGAAEGMVDFISPTTYLEDDGEPFYKVLISLDRRAMDDAQQHLILPGMLVQADIITGNKSVMAFLLKPIASNIEQAFGER